MLQFLAFVAIFVLFLQVSSLKGRLRRAEDTLQEAAKRIGALQRLTGLLPPKPDEFAENQRWTGLQSDDVRPATRMVVPEAEPEQDPEFESEIAPTPEHLPTPEIALEEPAPGQQPVIALADTSPVPEALTDEIDSVEPADEPDVLEPFVAAEPEPTAEAEPDVTQASAVEPLEVASEAPVAPPPPRNLARQFEELFGKKLPIWAGGITLAIAGVLIVKYAIDAGFFGRIFTHGVQVISGVLFGLGLLSGAEFTWRNQDRVRDLRVPQALSGAGIATLYASVLVAANAYQLIGPLAAFAALAVITASALGLALRFGAPSALLGLAGGLAAPAMVGSMAPNVPLLAVYLGLTIAGLTGVSRMRRWPWLALAALVGGAGWSLWMVLASNALDLLGSLSIGGFVLLLAIALPSLAFDGPRSVLLRSVSAVVGAVQLAVLVAYGGFSPLHWGLFALLAAAAQFLAWRDRAFGIVPTISLGLSGLLLAIWPAPAPGWFAAIGLVLAAIHALPLLAKLWSASPRLQRALELCGLALAAPTLTKWHFWPGSDSLLALVALGAATLTGTGIALGWKHAARTADNRFACLTATSGALLVLALVLVLPHWLAPLGVAAVAAALLFFGKAAADPRIEPIAAAFAAATLPALVGSMAALVELPRLVTGAAEIISAEAVIRWAGLTALFVLFAARAAGSALRFAALAIAGGLAYGALAQVVPGWSLPLALAAVAAVLFALSQRRAAQQIEGLSASFAFAAVALLMVTGPEPLAQLSRLFASDAPVGGTALLRWGLLAGLFALFGWRASLPPLRLAAHAAAATLGYGLLAQLVPGWSLPLALATIAAALWLVGERGWTKGVGQLSVLFALATLPVLAISAHNPAAEWSRLWGSDAEVTLLAALRWGALTLLALLYAVRGQGVALLRMGQIGAALLGYGGAAQVVPGEYLMLVPVLGGAAAMMAAHRFAWPRINGAAASLAALSLGWALVPIAVWTGSALQSLIGFPMALHPDVLGLSEVIRRLLVPAGLWVAAQWFARASVPAKVQQMGFVVCGAIAAVAFHCVYRIGFVQIFGTDFAATGLGQRLGWEALLIGSGWLAIRSGLPKLAWGLVLAGTAHAVWYTLVLHNPLWTAQAVGGLPVLNLLVPAFAMAPLGLVLVGRLWPNRPALAERAYQLFAMVLVAGFGWASLRQVFHGTVLVDPGVAPLENILRSILFLAMAIGFLLHGIRKGRHDWRIASLVLMLGAVGKVFLFDASGLEGLLRIGSFVALGFSLIGIGWLYSRQLARPSEGIGV